MLYLYMGESTPFLYQTKSIKSSEAVSGVVSQRSVVLPPSNASLFDTGPGMSLVTFFFVSYFGKRYYDSDLDDYGVQ